MDKTSLEIEMGRCCYALLKGDVTDDGKTFYRSGLVRAINALKNVHDNGVTGPKEYTIQTIADNDSSYLIIVPYNRYSAYYGTISQAKGCGDQYSFTQAEIDNLKKRDDIAIDWNKAVIEQVEGNGD